MKCRVLVMNGSRIVQLDRGDGWINDTVEKAGNLKAGIYSIYTASPADKKGASVGVIVHSDKNSVYQQCGKKFTVHSRNDFDIVPKIGSTKSIVYDTNGRAVTSAATINQSRRRSR